MNMSNGAWVKNMCQKLENMCTDIDEFVCKEPVLYVGNQMVTVGGSVKNFFSGFVDDYVHTRAVNIVQHVPQLIPSKCIDLVGTSTKALVEIKENKVDSSTNVPKEAPLALKELCQKQLSIGLHHSEQITSEVNQHLVGESDSLINKTSDNISQVDSNTNDPKEAPLALKELCLKQPSTVLHRSEHITSEINQHLIGESENLIIDKTSDNIGQVDLNSSTNIQDLYNKSEEGESIHSDATACDYSAWGIENILDLDFEIDNMINGESLATMEENEALLNGPIDELECDLNTLTTHQSSELESSVTYNENQEENATHIFADALSSENLYDSLSSSFKNASVEPVTIDCNPTETVDYLSESSDNLSSCESFTTVAYDSNNEESCSGTGVANGSIVDSQDVKKDIVGSGVIVEGGKLSKFPNTSRSKSYKKMIQDAFMSRKRLTKEYKQLAVWYRDIDKELCQPTQQSSKLSAQDLPDSEWELL